MDFIRGAIEKIFDNERLKNLDSLFLVSIAFTLFFALDFIFGRPVNHLLQEFVYIEHLFGGFLISFWIFVIFYGLLEKNYGYIEACFFGSGIALGITVTLEILLNLGINLIHSSGVNNLLILSQLIQAFAGILGSVFLVFPILNNYRSYFVGS